MSTCISRAGEYSSHETTEGNYICDRCGVLDEDGIFAELDMLRRGGKTLGEIIHRQCRDALDATGLHHLIDEDGDGDWGLVWEHLAELRPRLERTERALAEERAKVADAWDEGYIHGRQKQANATADEAQALTSTNITTRAWLNNVARSLHRTLHEAKGSIHANPYRAALPKNWES